MAVDVRSVFDDCFDALRVTEQHQVVEHGKVVFIEQVKVLVDVHVRLVGDGNAPLDQVVQNLVVEIIDLLNLVVLKLLITHFRIKKLLEVCDLLDNSNLHFTALVVFFGEELLLGLAVTFLALLALQVLEVAGALGLAINTEQLELVTAGGVWGHGALEHPGLKADGLLKDASEGEPDPLKLSQRLVAEHELGPAFSIVPLGREVDNFDLLLEAFVGAGGPGGVLFFAGLDLQITEVFLHTELRKQASVYEFFTGGFKARRFCGG